LTSFIVQEAALTSVRREDTGRIAIALAFVGNLDFAGP
jgi:hypothetical protein